MSGGSITEIRHHLVTRAELVELVEGIPLLWELDRKNGSDIYRVRGY